MAVENYLEGTTDIWDVGHPPKFGGMSDIQTLRDFVNPTILYGSKLVQRQHDRAHQSGYRASQKNYQKRLHQT